MPADNHVTRSGSGFLIVPYCEKGVACFTAGILCIIPKCNHHMALL